MKFSALFVCLAILLPARSPAGERLEFILSAAELAREYLSVAVEEAESPEYKRLYRRMLAKLSRASWEIPRRGRNWEICISKGAAMFVHGLIPFGVESKIYICNDVFDRPSIYTMERTAQMILHELAHLVGYVNECSADLIHHSIVKLNGLSFLSVYQARCRGTYIDLFPRHENNEP